MIGGLDSWFALRPPAVHRLRHRAPITGPAGTVRPQCTFPATSNKAKLAARYRPAPIAPSGIGNDSDPLALSGPGQAPLAVQAERHPKQNRRCAMIGGLDQFASRAAVGPEHKKEHRVLLGMSPEPIFAGMGVPEKRHTQRIL